MPVHTLRALPVLVSLSAPSIAWADGPAESVSLPIAQLIERLGDPSFRVREESQRALISRGVEAVEPLTLAARSEEPEVALRAKLILARVDPRVVRVRIQRIALGPPARIVETLEGEGIASGEEPGEILLPEKLDPAERSSGYAIRYYHLPLERIDITAEETLTNSSFRNPLPPPGAGGGAVGILKRGDEAFYRQIGSHLERNRHPFLVTIRWWAMRRSRLGNLQESPASGNDLPALVRALVEETRSGAVASKLAALEILGLLGESEAQASFRSALDEEDAEDPNCRTAALIGLARLGDRSALRALRELLEAPEAPIASLGGSGGRSQAALDPRPRVSGARSWEARAALALVQAGDPAGFEHFARRIADVPPSEIHHVLSVLADEVPRATAETRELLLEGLSATEFLVHLAWDDPEVEYFYGRLWDHAAEGPRRGELGERLLWNLAYVLCSESGMGSARQRTFSSLWERIVRGAPPPGLASRLLKEILDRGGNPLKLSEVAAWLRPAFRSEPMPQALFERLLAVIRLALRRIDQDSGFAGGFAGGSALLEIARGPALTERQLVELVSLMAEAATTPNQPYAQDLFLELERLTGLTIQRPRGRPSPRRPPGEAKPSVPAVPQAEDVSPQEQVTRWASEPLEVSAALKRLLEGTADPGREALEYWEFVVRIPARPGRSGPGRPTWAAGARGVEVLWGIRHLVIPGVPSELTDRWGNRTVLRIEPERAGIPDAARYRLNGQAYLDLDLPVYVTLRERELGMRWYEASDVRLGASYLSKPSAERLQRLVMVRKPEPGRKPSAEEPPELWEEFWQRFFEGLSQKADDRRIQSALGMMRDLDLPQGERFLEAELRESDPRRRLQAAQMLAAACDWEGVRELMAAVRNRPLGINFDSALAGLDGFLTGCARSADQAREVLDLITSHLHQTEIQVRGFSIIAREAGTDFGYKDTLRLTVKQGRADAQRRAVEEARRWWAAHRVEWPASK